MIELPERDATQQIHHYLNAVWTVVAEANRYFAVMRHWRCENAIRRASNRVYVNREVLPRSRYWRNPSARVVCKIAG